VAAIMEALHIPAAILAKSGEVLAVNAAWNAGWPGVDEVAPRPGENYLDRCRAFAGWAPSPAGGVARVLSGARKSWDQACRLSGEENALCVRIRRIEHAGFSGFLVSHETAGLFSPEDVESRVLTAQMEERERLASELHDSVGQNLTCLGLGLTRLRRAAAAQSEVASIVGDMAESLQQVHAEIRTLSFLMQPPWLDDPNAFAGAVRELVAGFGRRAGIATSVQVKGRPQRLGKALQLSLFRILQECLANICRHAKADRVEVELLCRRDATVLEVRDNGCGMRMPEGASPTAGVGILGMRARLRRFGGDLRIVSGHDGTSVTARLPANAC
jgi:signal transduction histidine kinase